MDSKNNYDIDFSDSYEELTLEEMEEEMMEHSGQSLEETAQSLIKRQKQRLTSLKDLFLKKSRLGSLTEYLRWIASMSLLTE